VLPDPPRSAGSVPPPDGPAGTWDSLTSGPAEPSSPRRRKLLVAAVAIGVLALAGVAAGKLGPGDAGSPPRSPAHPSVAALPSHASLHGGTRRLVPFRPIPPARLAPAGLGSDPTFDGLARECSGGAMQACDELYDFSAPGSRYEAFADTCAGRQARGTNVYCVTAYPGS